jgi:hypothetical protein
VGYINLQKYALYNTGTQERIDSKKVTWKVVVVHAMKPVHGIEL